MSAAAHSIVAPSSASRWGPCPGSACHEAANPQPPTESTLEGEASHWIGSEVLSKGGGVANCEDFKDLTIFNGVLIDQDMVDAAAAYVAAVLSITPHAELKVEIPIKIPRVHAHCFGTPDCWWYDAASGVLHIWDYKYGWGLVEAFENLQGICYYAGILDELGIPDSQIRVAIHVVQPRPWHPEGSVRTWRVRAEDLRANVNQLNNSAHKALAADPAYCSGTHCRYCKGRHSCLSSEQAAMYSVDVSGQSPPVELDNEGVGIELAILRRAYTALEYRITGLEAQGLELARQGQVIPGQRVGHGSGSTIWTKPVGEVLALGDLMGIDLKQPAKPCTPKQAVTKGHSKEMIAQYSEHRSGAARLVPDNNNKARQIFGGIKQ